MTTYTILLPGDEDHRAPVSPEERARARAGHDRFSQTLAQRGHAVIDGAFVSSEGSA